MTPREYLGSATVPGGQELKLYRRGGDHMIVLDRNELMSSRMSGSEKQLALMTIDRLRGRKAPHLLIGFPTRLLSDAGSDVGEGPPAS